MMIDTERASCTKCGAKLEKVSQTVVDETADGIVLLCIGFCSCENLWHQWYEHFGYKGHMSVEKTGKICARG